MSHISKPKIGSPMFPWQVQLSPWQRFRRAPAEFLVQWLDKRRTAPAECASAPQSDGTAQVRIVSISDTHNNQPSVPDWGDLIYLNGTATQVNLPGGRSLSIYGSPLTEQCGTFAFQYPPIREVWQNRIPDDTDVVLVHGPPRGYLDNGGKGCPQLLREIWRVRPRLVVFGHIHVGYGRRVIRYDEGAEEAYARVFMGSGGVLAVLSMFWNMMLRPVGSLLLPSFLRATSDPPCGVLVNAALMSGKNGDALRDPVVVVM